MHTCWKSLRPNPNYQPQAHHYHHQPSFSLLHLIGVRPYTP